VPVLSGSLFLPASEEFPRGVIEWVTMPVHDLPHPAFTAKYLSDAQRIGVKIPSPAGRNGALDRRDVAKVAADTRA
jgi:hypothetical protein